MNNIQPEYGIIGNPVEQSLSPVMHNAAFKELGIDAVYKLFPLKEEELKPFFDDFKKENSPIFGLNVTVPYKEAVIPYLDTLAPLAQRAMAVNTIVVGKDRKLTGYNTDAPGFLTHMAELKFDIVDKRVAILGAGGSTKALLTCLCMVSDRPESIKVYNRTPEHLDQLLEDVGQRVDLSIVKPVQSVDDLNIELCDLLINTTSLGMKESDDCLVDEDDLNSNVFVYDLIYNPRETRLLKMAKAKGAKTANGLGMLYYQGILAFQHWANIQLNEEVKMIMLNSLEEALS